MLSGSSSGGSGGSIAVLTASILAVGDQRIKTKDGQQLHDLAPAIQSIDPKNIGVNGTGTVTVDFFAKDDGTPVIMEFTLDHLEGNPAVHLTGTMDFTFTSADATVAAPDPLFTTLSSKRGYKVGYPQDWSATRVNGWDTLRGPNGEVMQVRTGPFTGSLAALSGNDVYILKKQDKVTIISNTSAVLDGVPARLIKYRFRMSGVSVYGIDLVAVRKGSAFALEWESLAGNESADTTTFALEVESFVFSK